MCELEQEHSTTYEGGFILRFKTKGTMKLSKLLVESKILDLEVGPEAWKKWLSFESGAPVSPLSRHILRGFDFRKYSTEFEKPNLKLAASNLECKSEVQEEVLWTPSFFVPGP